MKDASPLVRTDFSSDESWRRMVDLATAETEEGFKADLDPIDERSFDGATPADLVKDGRWGGSRVLFVLDAHTLEDCESTFACVDLRQRPGRTFRSIPSALWGVENNLRLANMDFAEFADHADEDGIFRGF